MKYIVLLVAIDLAATQNPCEAGMKDKTNCTSIFAKNETMRCCWVEGTIKNKTVENGTEPFTFDACTYTNMTMFDDIYKNYQENMDNLKYDCSSKYLYVASLFALLFLL